MQLYLYDFSEIDGDDVNERGEFHGAFGWPDLTVLADHCKSS